MFEGFPRNPRLAVGVSVGVLVASAAGKGVAPMEEVAFGSTPYCEFTNSPFFHNTEVPVATSGVTNTSEGIVTFSEVGDFASQCYGTTRAEARTRISTCRLDEDLSRGKAIAKCARIGKWVRYDGDKETGPGTPESIRAETDPISKREWREEVIRKGQEGKERIAALETAGSMCYESGSPIVFGHVPLTVMRSRDGMLTKKEVTSRRIHSIAINGCP